MPLISRVRIDGLAHYLEAISASAPTRRKGVGAPARCARPLGPFPVDDGALRAHIAQIYLPCKRLAGSIAPQ